MRFVDAFAGIGGFHLGVQKAIPNARCVLSIEKDKHCQKIYKKNFPKTPIAGDITKLREEDVPQHDLFCAGFPCQPFSIAGKMTGIADVRGTLFYDILRILKYHKPKYVILENVPQILTNHQQQIISIIYNRLRYLNYHVNTYCLNSLDYGLAQCRNRCFILCGINYAPPIQVAPKPLCYITQQKVPSKYYINEPYYITKDLIPNITDKPHRIGHIKHGRQGERIYSAMTPAITLTAQGGGLAGKTGIYLTNPKQRQYHQMKYCTGGIRKLTPRECARLQGFPSHFILDEDPQAYKQFGNAVSVNIVEDIVKQI